MVKAVLVEAENALPRVVDVVPAPVGETSVRVLVKAAGVCHSDLSMINGTITPSYPVVLGHEAAGVVAEVGSGVRSVAPGDHVVFNWAAPCRECWFCMHGHPHLCTRTEGVVSLDEGVTTADGTAVQAALGIGAFAEEVVVDQRSVVKVGESLNLEVAALLGCAVLTGVGAVLNTGRVGAGESVLVVGQGGIGMAAIAGARLAGATTIIAADVAEEKRARAIELGATDFLVSDATLARQVRGLTEGRGVDHAFECVGHPATIRAAWSATRRGGQTTIVGVGGKDQEVSFNALELFHFARKLTSSIYGDSDPDRDIPELSSLILTGQLDLEPLITDRIGLDGVNAAFDRMRAGQGGRSVIVF